MPPNDESSPRWFASLAEFQQIIGRNDWVLLDASLPRALCRQIEAVTPHVLQYRDGDLEEVEAQICHLRSKLDGARIFVMTPSPRESDRRRSSTRRLGETCRRFGAILLVDLAPEGPDAARVRVERVGGPRPSEGDW